MVLKDPALRLEKRFINYLISFPFARKARSKADGVEDEEKEQRRKLLEVERLNYEERDRKAQARQRFSDRVSEELHEEIYHRALETIEDGDYVRERLIPLPEKLPELLDTLSLKAASMRRIESLVQGMDWFHTGLLRTVNQPPFIDRNRQVKVDNLRVAMSFAGTENLPFAGTCLHHAKLAAAIDSSVHFVPSKGVGSLTRHRYCRAQHCR